MDVKIAPSWKDRLSEEFDKAYFQQLIDFVKEEYQTQTVYPPGKEIFRAFDCCDFDQVKVVIIGQDPYHGPGQANGLCFSVRKDVRMPPSLVNIFKDAVIREISERRENVVFLLWGAYAQKKGEVIDRKKHFVLMSAHPSPF